MTETTPKNACNNLLFGKDTDASVPQTLGGDMWRLISSNVTSVLFEMHMKINQVFPNHNELKPILAEPTEPHSSLVQNKLHYLQVIECLNFTEHSWSCH